MMQMSVASYYRDPNPSRGEQEEFEANIREKIEQIRFEIPRAGYRPLLSELKSQGIDIGERRLRKILSKFKLQIKPKKKFINTTQSKHKFAVYENLIKGIKVTNINQLWVSDITYIRIENGFVFLAVILDVYSRKVIGWSISKKIDRYLTLSALKMAISRRKPTKKLIHHSDRGVQYLCDEYVSLLKEHKIKISCSRKANPYDSAFAESFVKILKYNEVYLWSYETILDVIERVPHFIEEVYNKKRRHSALGYLSPEVFEKELKLKYKKKSTGRYVVTIGSSTLKK